MEIQNIKLKDLKPYANNPRNNADAVDYVANSIKEFGFRVPIVIDSNNTIVCGHTRYLACKKLKIKEVPCVVADDLTDEQIKAFRLADNKVAEKAEWDYDLLNTELDDIISIDMEDFGFEFDFVDEEYEHDKHAEETQRRVANILNLEYAQFEGTGKYDIPILEPVCELPKIKEWIGFNYVLSDSNPEGKAVHFFIDDYQFERLWNNPERYVDKLKQYVCVATPDYSPYGDMPLATQIFNIYRKNWIGAYLQRHGVTVIPTLRCSSDERSLEFWLDGTPENGIYICSNMWTKKNISEDKIEFDNKVDDAILALNPKKIFIYGNQGDSIEEKFKGEIEYIKKFTDKYKEVKGNE